jgi:hypothetical protein
VGSAGEFFAGRFRGMNTTYEDYMKEKPNVSIEVAIESTKTRAAELAHILDMQGLAALLAHVLYVEAHLKQLSGTSMLLFSEDQMYSIIVSGMHQIEHVELGPDGQVICTPVTGPSDDLKTSS